MIDKEMNLFYFLLLISYANAQFTYESNMNFRVDAGSRTCFFESGRAGQIMEAQYEVLDGQHGDLDISFDIIDPNGVKIISDYKKSQNSIIRDLEIDGDYAFCMDNTFSTFNSKLVFAYVLIEDKIQDEQESVVVEGGNNETVVLEWSGTTADGQTYFIEVAKIADSLTRTLKYVLKARHLLDIYGAMKSRDSYLAFEDTFIVDVWSGFQITVMFSVGMLQVYMIKKLFNRPTGSICY